MSKGSDFIVAVDAFMAAPKGLLGIQSPVWQPSRDAYAVRLKLPIEIGGELSGQHLVIDACPNHDPRRFHIGIQFADRVVCRLDYDPRATHSNDWAPTMEPFVRGPHWHSWELNRQEFKALGVQPKKLKLAVAFTQAREFDACLRWYCNARNIVLGAHSITYPERGLLL